MYNEYCNERPIDIITNYQIDEDYCLELYPDMYSAMTSINWWLKYAKPDWNKDINSDIAYAIEELIEKECTYYATKELTCIALHDKIEVGEAYIDFNYGDELEDTVMSKAGLHWWLHKGKAPSYIGEIIIQVLDEFAIQTPERSVA